MVNQTQTSVEPALVPKRRLYTGAEMPAIGLGTFGSDHVSADEIAAAVQGAIEVGYRHLDCASVYGNEDRIGAALREVGRRRARSFGLLPSCGTTSTRRVT